MKSADFRLTVDQVTFFSGTPETSEPGMLSQRRVGSLSKQL
jgi:hypothetical protein